jgi:predicted lipoprotein with Yx(FWY)xxD motif
VKEEINVRILHGKSGRGLFAVALLALLGLVAAGCGGSSSSSSAMPKSGVAGAQHSTSSSVAVKTHKISGYGKVLVNKKGRTLYIFMKDHHHKVTCTGNCLSFWFPLKWKGSHKPKAGAGAKSSLVGWVKFSGGKVVTYKKWPLYTYSGDTGNGQANGENQTLNGGKWYLMSGKGKIIKHKMSSGGGGGTSTGGGGWG